MMLTIGSLFSGIGGLELGLERAGLGPVLFQVEKDPFCQRVLAKHWPNVPRFDDVAQLRSYPDVDVLCGGFPCQDVSSAGKRRGLGGSRSGLWFEFARIISEIRPRFVVVENVASGASKWLPQVRRDLHVLGYDSTAYALSAEDVGAPHLRRRVFVVADRDGELVREQPRGQRRKRGQGTPLAGLAGLAGSPGDGDGDGDGEPVISVDDEVARLRGLAGDSSAWATPPEFCGMADGVPDRMDRLHGLGNAVVPQCAEVIGRIVLEMSEA